jgi:CBS domain containing-hemolysin-like protein
MVKLLFFFLVSIIFSFLCSIWEAVILSISPTYVKRIQKEKPKIGKWLHQFKKDIDRPLSAILTLNTIAHTVGAIGVGVQAGRIFGSHQINFFVFELTYESLVAGLMTLAILILSEIIPKTLGANYWKQLMPFTVHSLRILLVVLAPFVWISKLITRLIKNDKERSVSSRADVEAMAEVGLESGAIDKEEKSIIQNLLRLENLKVKDIMTPRSVVLAVDETLTLSEIYKENRPIAYSRIPVYKDQSENITGLIL